MVLSKEQVKINLKKSIQKYRRGKGLQISRDIQNRLNTTRNEFGALRRMVGGYYKFSEYYDKEN